MDSDAIRRGGAAGLFLLGVDAAYNVMGGSNSSPQTTEVFGKGKRKKTLMKWVYLAEIKILLYTGFASWIAPKGVRFWPIFGGLIVAVEMHLSYVYAAKCATRDASSPSGDEIDYGGGAAQETPGMSLRGGNTSVPTTAGAPLRTR